jgi:pimeloyl-ACP methyl ester carboxylesterase
VRLAGTARQSAIADRGVANARSVACLSLHDCLAFGRRGETILGASAARRGEAMEHLIGSRRMRRTAVICVVLGAAAVAVLLVIGSGAGKASAQTAQPLDVVSSRLAANSPLIPSEESCASIGTLTTLAADPQYPTAITSTTVVPASPGNTTTPANPEYCDVKGMIAPQTHFDLQLPVNTWQGRYLQNGCGGYCGAVSSQTFPSCDATLGGDFAMATDDEGHVSANGIGGALALGGAGLFAFNDQKLRDEYGYQSEQALYVIAKKIITYFYGVPPNYNYYDGCSDGGREAMEMAERYPDDFNGIIAGAPEIIAGPLNAEFQTWQYRVNTDANGNAILTAAQLPTLHQFVMNACQGDDGVPGDGIITDPRSCHPDLSKLVCIGTNTSNCLTAAQVEVAEKIYQGPEDPRGRHLYPGGLPYGSELSWAFFVVPLAPGPSTNALVYLGLSQPYLRYQLLEPGRLGPDPSQWQFNDQGFRAMFPAADTFDAMSTDLSAFRRHGGKLLMWQGWADQAIPPFGTVDYYDTLTQRNGGLTSTEQFARLFLFPTVAHCGGGYANSSFDVVLPMVQWVEQGVAPGEIDASDTINGTPVSRPVYPYPEIPQYNGSGPTSDASSFHPAVSPGAGQYSNWIGNYLFYQPIGSGSDEFGGDHHRP